MLPDLLATVNTYTPRGNGLAADLALGPHGRRAYDNFYPIIADFVAKDMGPVEKRKAEISAEEWDKAWVLGKAWLSRPGSRAREGNPAISCVPAD